jgi:signal transduction histidine kinase
VFGLMQLIDFLHSEFENDSKEEIESYLSTISNASKSVFELLQNLLIWARSQTNCIEFQSKPESIKNLTDSVINILEPVSKGKNIKIHNNIKPYILGLIDSNMISTVLRNLISNSIKFSYSEQDIYVDAIEQDSQIFVSIEDHGIGMNPEQLKLIFKIDSGIKSLGTNNEKGTGLGLIICKEFIEKHGGKIWVESQENKGSKFFFSITKFNQT